MKNFGLKGGMELTGQVTRKEKNGDLSIVDISWLGASFTIFGNDDIYNQCEEGQVVKITADIEVDPKSSNNKLRLKRSTIRIQVAA